jgi:hypothetical protein
MTAPAFLTITNQRGKSARKSGDNINGNTLIEPVGAHHSLYWRYSCGSCGAVHTIASSNMNNLTKSKVCRNCRPQTGGKKT